MLESLSGLHTSKNTHSSKATKLCKNLGGETGGEQAS